MKKKFFVLFFLIASFLSVEAKSDWKASWIVPSGCTSETNSWVVYRKMVNINQVPKTLLAHIAADSKYWLWINGEMVVFEGGLKRGPSLGDSYYDEVNNKILELKQKLGPEFVYIIGNNMTYLSEIID